MNSPFLSGVLPTRTRTTRAKLLASALAMALTGSLYATDYYVATGGNDSANGAQSSPFRTISRAVSLAQPGDNVYVRGGTYRETVTFPRSGTATAPITLAAYPGEQPVINGCDVISGWVSSGGKLWAGVGAGLGDGNNQVFVDGVMQNEGRFPDASIDISRSPMRGFDSTTVTANGAGSKVVVNDSGLKLGAGSLVGAKIVINNGWFGIAVTGTVTANAPGSITFTTPTPVPYTFYPGMDFYYVYGLPSLADQPGEWFFTSSNCLALGPAFTDSPSNHLVEFKRRQLALDLSDRSYIKIDGIDLFGSRVKTTSASKNVSITNMTAEFVGHNLNVIPNAAPDPGIELNGDNSSITNSVVAYSSGSGISLNGSNGTIRNVQIHDVNYGMGNLGGITVTGANHLVQNNTVYNVGRFGVCHYNTSASQFLNNDVFNFGIKTTDCGGFYSWNTNGGGTEIGYNTVHNGHGSGPGVVGIMLDNGSNSMTIHHNIVWDTDTGVVLAGGSDLIPITPNVKIVANTLDCTTRGLWVSNTVLGLPVTVSVQYPGLVVANIASSFPHVLPTGFTATTSYSDPSRAIFASAATLNYAPVSGTPLIDAASSIAPVNNPITGSGPDIGALEYGQAPFVTGETLSTAPPAAPLKTVATPGLRLANVSWLARPDATSYNVYRSVAGQDAYTQVGSGVTSASFTDLTPAPDAQYDYIVTAVNAAGESGFSDKTTTWVYSDIKLHGLIGEYYTGNNPTDGYGGTAFSTPTFRRLDANVDFDWGYGSPDDRLPADGFTVVWTGIITAPATGTYTFKTSSDDGVRLTVDGSMLIDKFYGGAQTNTGTVNLVGGRSYSIRLEYLEGVGAANCHLLWTVPGAAETTVPSTALAPSAGAGVETSFYNDTPSTFGSFGTYVTSQVMGFGTVYPGSPVAGVNADWWSSKSFGQLLAPVDATYTFKVGGDNGTRFYMDGKLLSSRWDQTVGATYVDVPLKAGTLHDIELDFAEATGDAACQLSWSFPGQSLTPVPTRFLYTPMNSTVNGLVATYYSDTAFRISVGNKEVTTANGDWTSTPPTTGLGTTGYSIRYKGRITGTGTTRKMYAFNLDGIGRARLFVNGQLLIDGNSTSSWSTLSRVIWFDPGVKYDITLEYAADSVPGKLHLQWKSTDFGLQDIPKSNLFLNYTP